MYVVKGVFPPEVAVVLMAVSPRGDSASLQGEAESLHRRFPRCGLRFTEAVER